MKQVGRGAFGTAQLVRDKRDGLRYILKKTRLARQPERQREATIMEMFIQRATAHRNVVRCKESWMEKGFVACLVLEYCGGGELADVLNNRLKRELFDEEALLGWAAQLASALAYLHANAIVHRDVKAANIFIRDDKSLALGDFGLAQTPDTSPELKHTMMGTPQYMAPGSIPRSHLAPPNLNRPLLLEYWDSRGRRLLCAQKYSPENSPSTARRATSGRWAYCSTRSRRSRPHSRRLT